MPKTHFDIIPFSLFLPKINTVSACKWAFSITSRYVVVVKDKDVIMKLLGKINNDVIKIKQRNQ